MCCFTGVSHPAIPWSKLGLSALHTLSAWIQTNDLSLLTRHSKALDLSMWQIKHELPGTFPARKGRREQIKLKWSIHRWVSLLSSGLQSFKSRYVFFRDFFHGRRSKLFIGVCVNVCYVCQYDFNVCRCVHVPLYVLYPYTLPLYMYISLPQA